MCTVVFLYLEWWVVVSAFFVFCFCKQKTAYELLRSLVGSEMCIRDRVSIMSTVNEQLLKATLALPEEDRLEFLEAISQSLQQPGLPPLDESWRSVIKKRSEEIRSGKVNLSLIHI